MAETQYAIREIATGNVIHCNWQNAFELVNHGFWQWAKGNGAKEFKHAQREAKGQNPDPRGFEHLNDVDDINTDDDEDYVPPTVKPVAPAAPAPAKPTVSQIADTPVFTGGDALEDMSREELFAEAERLEMKVDKRTGTKNLITAIRAHNGEE